MKRILLLTLILSSLLATEIFAGNHTTYEEEKEVNKMSRSTEDYPVKDPEMIKEKDTFLGDVLGDDKAKVDKDETNEMNHKHHNMMDKEY